ncbi:MAG: 50S ribosomal protein L11 [Parcubacteria group bacterium CG08_land_8_20_14_0_20_48_21]|nr:MAG: 50S ribosomal protein L11 [Parcubacteria group bacterium CG2_30_48_51]PIS33057.1 MAG: 50S ribosomal protein L11 [Parcubacteria group bacterium CG08_land_8_20_14_0_20_48_21]PIW79197.1 MAG: 50S ribosomal protein L11 [Parcubacteria group bacterium CG_4_8_14_3_um_filter_48_16]PIY77873.1 MAG: 50S ribosomal protein L11 [Parcubacteria group bacterium CG_4_10_14_0_8_um_filter_48_154]PIZ77318.1 MAG: 50S ribosomal protein L11 [bacterium CG_4_10_14_0_2_um_filter_48_144]PJC39502.1 MAG: 50S ribosom
MAKPIKALVKLQIVGGQATPAPPVGTALGPHGVNMQEFCTKFNDATKSRMGEVVPIVMTIFEDRTFTFVLKTAPASEMLKKAAGIKKGSGNPLLNKVGKVTKAQVKEIAEAKMPDLNAHTVDAAMKIVEGTARQMGLEVTE